MSNKLVPIGTSSDSFQTLQYAIDYASHVGAEIFVMDVFSVSSKAGTLGNLEEKVAKSSLEHLRAVIAKVDTKGMDIRISSYNGDIIDGLASIDRELGIYLLIMAPRSNDVREELYWGHT